MFKIKFHPTRDFDFNFKIKIKLPMDFNSCIYIVQENNYTYTSAYTRISDGCPSSKYKTLFGAYKLKSKNYTGKILNKSEPFKYIYTISNGIIISLLSYYDGNIQCIQNMKHPMYPKYETQNYYFNNNSLGRRLNKYSKYYTNEIIQYDNFDIKFINKVKENYISITFNNNFKCKTYENIRLNNHIKIVCEDNSGAINCIYTNGTILW